MVDGGAGSEGPVAKGGHRWVVGTSGWGGPGLLLSLCGVGVGTPGRGQEPGVGSSSLCCLPSSELRVLAPAPLPESAGR